MQTTEMARSGESRPPRKRIGVMARHFRAYGGFALGGLLVVGLLLIQGQDPRTEERYAASHYGRPAMTREGAPVPARVFWAERAVPTTLASATEALQQLRDGLASEQIAERVEAIRQAATSGDERVLALLTATSLEEDPATVPTRILAVGALGQRLTETAQTAAVETLAQWLATASHEQAPGDAGHLALLVETVGKINCDKAADSLIAVLEDPRMPLHVQTLAVQGLGRMQHAAAASALNAFRRGLMQRQMQDKVDTALIREAQAALAQAVESLSNTAAKTAADRPWTTP